MLPILIQQSRSAAGRVACSAAPDAPVVPSTASGQSAGPAPGVVRRHVAAILRRSAERPAPVAR